MEETPQQQKKKSLTFTIPLIGFPRTMRFNRFVCEPMGTYQVFHCGYIGKQGSVCDVLSFAMANEDLDINRENVIKYIDRLTNVEEFQPESWAYPSTIRNVENVRIISCGNSGHNSEIILSTFSLAGFLSKGSTASGNETAQAQPIALLSCEVKLQKYVLTTMFLDSK
jgi:hypothetical protein